MDTKLIADGIVGYKLSSETLEKTLKEMLNLISGQDRQISQLQTTVSQLMATISQFQRKDEEPSSMSDVRSKFSQSIMQIREQLLEEFRKQIESTGESMRTTIAEERKKTETEIQSMNSKFSNEIAGIQIENCAIKERIMEISKQKPVSVQMPPDNTEKVSAISEEITKMKANFENATYQISQLSEKSVSDLKNSTEQSHSELKKEVEALKILSDSIRSEAAASKAKMLERIVEAEERSCTKIPIPKDGKVDTETVVRAIDNETKRLDLAYRSIKELKESSQNTQNSISTITSDIENIRGDIKEFKNSVTFNTKELSDRIDSTFNFEKEQSNDLIEFASGLALALSNDESVLSEFSSAYSELYTSISRALSITLPPQHVVDDRIVKLQKISEAFSLHYEKMKSAQLQSKGWLHTLRASERNDGSTENAEGEIKASLKDCEKRIETLESEIEAQLMKKAESMTVERMMDNLRSVSNKLKSSLSDAMKAISQCISREEAGYIIRQVIEDNSPAKSHKNILSSEVRGSKLIKLPQTKPLPPLSDSAGKVHEALYSK